MQELVIRAYSRDEAGAIAVLFAICSTVLFLVAALVVDLGLARDVRGESQNASDASALAAGNVLYADGTGHPDFDAAVAAAEDYAAVNMGTTDHDWATCTDPNRPAGYYVVPGKTQCVSFDEKITPSHVRVRLPERAVRLSFGGVTGVQSVDISTLAETNLSDATRSECGVCMLGTGLDDLQNGEMTVSNANVRTNGSVNLQDNGHVSVVGGAFGIAGTATGSNFSPAVDQHQPSIADPLGNYTMPPLSPTPAAPYRSDPCTEGPGIYDSVSLSGSTSCTLKPGIYYITGTWSISGQAKMDATAAPDPATGVSAAPHGVTLFFTCSNGVGQHPVPQACATSGQAGGQLNASGTGGLAIHAPTEGITQGISILYDRHNTSKLVFTGQGATKSTTGTIYAASATFLFNGNGNGAMMDTLIIVSKLELNGNPSVLNTQYTPELNAPIKPIPLALSK